MIGEQLMQAVVLLLPTRYRESQQDDAGRVFHQAKYEFAEISVFR